MGYLDYNEFQQIMKTEKLETSEAVKLYLNKAIYYSNMIKTLKRNSSVVHEVIYGTIKQYEAKRIEAVIEALSIADKEKKQGWKYIEDLDLFMQALGNIYKGKLKDIDKYSKLKIELATYYQQAQKKQRDGIILF